MIVQRENEQNRWKMNNIFVEISEKIGEKGLIFRNIPFIKKVVMYYYLMWFLAVVT